MTYTVFGPGSVGTVLAGLLADGGVEVRIMGRGAVGSLHLSGDREEITAQVPVVQEADGTILLCVHEPDLLLLCPRWRGRTVVTFQNGVRSEEYAARWCDVIGGVWRMTCTFIAPGRARFTRRGRVVVGRHPDGVDDGVRALAGDLSRAGLDVGLSDNIAADKWLKLFLNLTSAPNALVRRGDHEREEFGTLKAAVLEEARDLFAAAGVTARSCDGHDLSLDDEIEKQRRGGGRRRPVYNSTWRQLHRGRRPKERYHDTILELAKRAGRPAPRNTAMLELLDAASEPECYGVDEVVSAVCGT